MFYLSMYFSTDCLYTAGDGGRIVWDADYNIIFEAGQQPVLLTEDSDKLCAWFAEELLRLKHTSCKIITHLKDERDNP